MMMSKMTAVLLNDLRAKFGHQVTANQLQSVSSQVYWIAAGGGLPKVSRGVYSLGPEVQVVEGVTAVEVTVEPAKEMTKEEKSAIISERFDVLDMLTRGVIAGEVRAMMVAGAPGVGKSYLMEEKLAQAEKIMKLKSMTVVKGSISPIGLYILLWENRLKGQVLVLDDADSIFNDDETVNILKAALDTSKKRTISWLKESHALNGREIDKRFDYNGQIVFLTNVDMERESTRNSRIAPHIAALLSRSVFLDLAIHSADEIMIRIEQVMSTTEMRKDLELTHSEAEEILDWMRANLKKMRNVSLRTVIQIASFYRSTEEWKKLAGVTLLRQRG